MNTRQQFQPTTQTPTHITSHIKTPFALLCFGLLSSSNALSNSSPLDTMEVVGAKTNLIGEAISASEGRVSQSELDAKPILRTGDILEAVPGLVATQHSGNGKANQYFLRGFNLDHGTDFNTAVDAMPVNMRTHGHGQGYTDLNFIIPELINEVIYRKGSYYADVADFSGAGAATLTAQSAAIPTRLKLGMGEDNFIRTLVTGSLVTGEQAADGSNSHLIYGVEYQTYDGPWDDVEEDVKKKNLWVKHHWNQPGQTLSLTLMVYDNQWNSADQIPQRAVDAGIISDLGSIDPTLGGESERYSLSGAWQKQLSNGRLDVSLYAISYEMQLWSNFSYFTNDDGNGDQFQQLDDRNIYGWDIAWTAQSDIAGKTMENTLGTQSRYDDIKDIALRRTQDRMPLPDGSIRADAVEEYSLSLYWQNTIHWNDAFRSVFGLRYDYFDFDVTAKDAADPTTLTANSGSADDDIVTPTLSLIYSFNPHYEGYVSVGKGFHSNDARGVTSTRNPDSGEEIESADPLVDTLGYETGLRAFITDQVNASIALWRLEIDSELLFVGDEGTNEDTGESSTREGVEFTLYYWLDPVWTFDFEYAYTDASFDDADVSDIPGALEQVITLGANADFANGLQGSLHWRYFDEYPLDDGQTADSSSIVNARMSYQWTPALKTTLDILNLLDSDDHDVEYYYESQLATEATPVGDHHYHVFEPRTFRLYVEYQLD